MTPQEAVAELVARGLITKYVGPVQTIIEAVEATAKADETKQCVGLARNIADLAESCGGHKVAECFRNYANDLLTTGGLEVNETDGKMKRRSQ